MPQGLQVFDGAGNITLDVGNSVLVLQGTVQTTPNQAGQITMDASLGTPFVIVNNPPAPTNGGYSRPTVTVSGSTISWNAANYQCYFFYGTR